MTKLVFYGSSDDLFYAGPVDDQDEFYSPFALIVVADGGQLVVQAHYAATGAAVWAISVAPVDEDIPIPDWPMRFTLAERGYSAQLEIEVPDKASIRPLAVSK